MKKASKFILLLIFVMSLSLEMMAWPGMPLPRLHVNGRQLNDPCGNNVILHGVAITPSPWFNGCQYGFSSSYCTWDNYDVEGCLDYNFRVMDRLTNTADGWHLNYIRLHIDPYWTNDPGEPIHENDISRFNYNRLVKYTDEVIIPLMEHAKQRGLYVILRPPGVCPQRISQNDAYYNYLETVWDFLSSHSYIKNADHVMFELANEPVNILGVNGNWGSVGDEHFAALKNYFQPLVDMIRNNGANNICWIPGSGWQSHYQGYVNHRITGDNIGYAVHIYPAYWGGVRNYTAFQAAWNTNVKPIADLAPIVITETDWAPEGYDTFGTATTGTAGGDGFGANFNHITYMSGNVSWNVLAPDNLLDHGDPDGGTAYNGDWEACAAPVKHWFAGFAQENVPSSCSSTPPSDDDFYTMTNRLTNKCIQLQDGSYSNYANIIQADCNSSYWSQQWTLSNIGDGYFLIKSKKSGKCMRAVDGNIVQYDCEEGYWSEMFSREATSDGYYIYINRSTNQCLRVENSSSATGASIVLDDCNANYSSQQFIRNSLKSATVASEDLAENEDAFPTDVYAVYPTSSSGLLNVNLPDDYNQQAVVSIYSTSGSMVMKVKLTESVLDISSLTKGLYLVLIQDGGKTYTHKIVKK
ncbi:cellulase family glycosylhydrolase [Plebeiibacterium sediminum]|uniref:Cellulase family glycosylhydrolase n=1 Tax=Plebeiibacterium sediminum TaxID=2992112 RepID=A0AAE3M1W8_9BACT|nr:RICIN domain-containing protein [Plebeiobacterium sediminum]MCW3785337.1 cellulase family glycosylhydrolase [Plebeiobacterium sediminum]